MYRFFEGLLNPFPSAEPVAPPTTMFSFCRYYARGSEPFIILMAVLAAVLATLEVSLFSFLGQLIDLLSAHTPETLMAESGHTLLWMGFVVVVCLPTVVFFHSAVIHQTLLGNFPMIIRWLAHRYLLGQSLAFYQNEFAGTLATKIMQTALAVRETILKVLDVFLYVLVYFTGILFIVATLDWYLVLPFLVWFVVYVSLLYYFLPRLQARSEAQANARSVMSGRLADTYANIATVKLFSHSRRESDYAREGMHQFLQTVHPQMRLVTSLSFCIWFINSLLIFVVSATSITLWMHASISTGAIAVSVGLVLRLFGMSQWIMWEVSGLFENIGAVKDGMNTLTRARAVQDIEQAQKLQVDNSAGIIFNHVRFQYSTDHDIVDDFCLHIKPGEKIGLVGRSGAGKSTLVNLLLRFYDIKSGAISIDGQNIATITQESLRANIGMVSQDTSLLHRSIKDNLIYGKHDASDGELIEAAQQAHAHEFIQDLNDSRDRKGYEAFVGERGVTLSGGQRQRIAIARVLLKNAPILVLDEATSALDSEVEAAIQENLNTLMQGKTVIAIAHRLSTIAALDRLIVIDKGRIVEQGTHADLVKHNGVYAQLWAHQSGGFLASD
ncbi:MAG: ATP-binding cassette subfamily B multidrug efflux pump [Lentisphaeria bacterium]|jgi:ATP-binding cassette subfamily B multidrug efflux pump